MSQPVIRMCWPGFAGIENLVIFGASYCDVGFDRTSPHPTPERPLGVEYPGITYAEPGEPNWVGHLVKKYSPCNKMLVYDYGTGGDKVPGVKRQIEHHFLPTIASRPDHAPWKENNTLFITWVGINDSSWIDIDEIPEVVQTLFDLQGDLYGCGARNFLLVDIPPLHRKNKVGLRQQMKYETWNTNLRKGIIPFTTKYPEATAMIYSSWDTFNRVLDDPTSFGFTEQDTVRGGGAIWVDHIHPTSKMHDIIAQDMAKLLAKQAPLPEIAGSQAVDVS
ncbi:carbohydrate esterase family 16 protein [Jaapia argillacea MUCL 33604]|uniref:Carbohydrate esterase family 16 protein n=1 Tax=Jaapia argillacea MUCL 33604 TaxID=933084 RepID=A0A067Q1N8_9AGAM|nr:carbohydrate esterase family 16 protein [Jaapia argillacea MUCL 33604]